jgi:hypothetical protein
VVGHRASVSYRELNTGSQQPDTVRANRVSEPWRGQGSAKSTYSLQLLEEPIASLNVRCLETSGKFYVIAHISTGILKAVLTNLHEPLAWISQVGAAGAVCWGAGAAASLLRPPKSIFDTPWPMTLPAATLPAVAAIWANMPGPLLLWAAAGWGTGVG